MRRTAAFLFLLICTTASSRQLGAQRPALVVQPADALIDEPVRISITGLPPNEPVVLRSYARADSATALVASARYVTDQMGQVVLDRDASTAGTYTGIDAMGLFWSGLRTPRADVAAEDLPDESIDPPRPMSVVLTVSIRDTVMARAVVTRRFEAADVRVEEVRSGDVVGRIFLPARPQRAPAVIVLSGSEGGYESSSYTARMLAAHGFAAFAQAYFRAEGLRDELASIPVERVQRGIEWLRKRGDVDASRVGIIGGSRGTELALLSAGYFDGISAVVVYGTSVTTGGGLTRNGEPHAEVAWTYDGKPLPAMQHRPPREALAQFSRPDPVRLRLLFEPGLSDVAAVARAAIPVSNIRADVLVISGLDDQMGPADIAGDMLIERLNRSGHKGRHIHLKYAEAGHVIGIPFMPTALRLVPWRFAYGGTPAGYARADADSWPRVLEFLRSSIANRK